MSGFLFQKPDIKQFMEELNGVTKDLSLKIYSLLECVELKKLEASRVEIFPEKNRCVFFLNPISNEVIEFQIDIYDQYYDLFANKEEVFIQQKNSNPDKSLRIIEGYLKSKVKLSISQNKENKILKKELKFYIKGELMNAFSNVSCFSFLYKKKHGKILNYDAWIDVKE
ncbi:hypothetical protein [Belliella pelovolcani]|uniref:Uncharacterized protein n=1 Tax=Belliella pelovolcani TaxID=529505 RepID=A0A1N7Q3E7_9BACT|nr:hypothetical protein [Belliella pelovolcani]SIT17382.1 hypothetical protein SAMN05421761_12713 [Belliella pelovolcani]